MPFTGGSTQYVAPDDWQNAPGPFTSDNTGIRVKFRHDGCEANPHILLVATTQTVFPQVPVPVKVMVGLGVGPVLPAKQSGTVHV
jgi:hypothetical protein